MVFGFGKKTTMPARDEALPGHDHRPFSVNPTHVVLGTPLEGPWPDGSEVLYVAMGCFWGVERIFWRQPGVINTSVGYMGGYTPNPTYEEVCSGRTGHAEVVRVVFDPKRVPYEHLLAVFWESHDPTQGMRQGNDVGTQYRSGIYYADEAQKAAALKSRDAYQPALTARGYGPITSEIAPLGEFYFAEAYHQQYLAKNPGGYCGVGGTGVSCPIGVLGDASAS